MSSMMKRVRFTVIGVLALGIVLPLWARDPGSPLSLSVRIEGEYDDNRDGDSSGQEDSFNIRLQPRAAFTYDLGITYVDLFYMPYILMRGNARDDQNDTELYHEVGAELRHDLTPTITLSMSDRFSVTDDPRVSEGGVTVRESANYTKNVLNLGLGIDMDAMTMMEIGGHSDIKRYSERAWRNFDEDKLGANLTLRRELGMMMNVLTTLRYTKSEYNDIVDRGAEFVFAGIGMEKTFSPNLAGYLTVGWNTANHNSLGGSTDTPAGNARVVLSPTPDTSLSLAASYELADSDWMGYSTQERTAFSATLNHRVTPQLASALTLERVLGAYKSDTAVIQGLPGGDDDLTAVHARAIYRMHQNLNLEIGYQFEDWDSDIRDSFNRNKYTVALRASL